MADRDPRRRFPVVLTVAAAIAFAILCGLGTWQFQRMQWKQTLLARIEAAKSQPTVPLMEVLMAMPEADPEFLRVSVRCGEPAAGDRTVYLLSPREGRTYWRPITPCRIDAAGYGAIALDRGLVEAETQEPPTTAFPAPRGVIGILRRPERLTPVQGMITHAENEAIGFQHRTSALRAVERNAGVALPDLMLVAEREEPAVPGVRPAPLPATISNRHLEYVITWFGLAAALAAVYAAMLMRRLKQP